MGARSLRSLRFTAILPKRREQRFTARREIRAGEAEERLVVEREFRRPAILARVAIAIADSVSRLIIEAVGVPATFELCESIVAPGGHIANIGVHGKSVDLHLETLWSQNITITTRLVDTITTPMLLKIVKAKKLDPLQLITHRFKLSDIIKAYNVFGHADKEKALKVILTNE